MTSHDPQSIVPRHTPAAPPATSDRARLLDLLGTEQGEALTISDLRERGVRMPGQAIYEIELDGYLVERVRRCGRTRPCTVVGYRLGAPAANTRRRDDARRPA